MFRRLSVLLLTAVSCASASAARACGRFSARSAGRAAVRPGLSLSAGRLDRPAHRGRTVRARLPARPAAGAGDRRLRALLRRHAQTPRRPTEGWKTTRTLVNALFLRRFDKEYLEEMKGIADGASRRRGTLRRPAHRPGRHRRPQLLARNRNARLRPRSHADRAGRHALSPAAAASRSRPPKPMHCSAFAATGPATADGKIVFGHITMFELYPSNFYNVWLDVKPAKGHRVLMRTYPGGIQSGMDYYINDAGLLICRDDHRPDPLRHQRA